MALGDNIKRLRRDKQWTQGELAEKSGVKVGHISKLERNESDPKLETIYKLINALGCSPNALLSDISKTSLDGRLEIVLERVQGLPEKEKEHILDVIDKYCIAVGLQGLMENSQNGGFLSLGLSTNTGRTEEMSTQGK